MKNEKSLNTIKNRFAEFELTSTQQQQVKAGECCQEDPPNNCQNPAGCN